MQSKNRLPNEPPKQETVSEDAVLPLREMERERTLSKEGTLDLMNYRRLIEYVTKLICGVEFMSMNFIDMFCGLLVYLSSKNLCCMNIKSMFKHYLCKKKILTNINC